MAKRELIEQREQSQMHLDFAESRKKKSKAQYIQANKDWLEAKAREEGVKALPKGIYYQRSYSHSIFECLNNRKTCQASSS